MTSNKIKILTLNIHKGLSLAKRKTTIDMVKENILDLGANIVCLQEVVGAYADLAKKSQYEFLAGEIWPHYAYGKNAVRSQGHHGNAILSQFPFLNFENFNISNYRLEKRGILHGVIKIPGSLERNLHIMTLHLDLMSWGRKRQVEKLCDLIEKHVPSTAPLVVCGDFNDWREELSEYLYERVGIREAYFARTKNHAKTFPTFLPLLKLDRLYVRNLEVGKILRPDSLSWHKISDHLALYAELFI